MPSPDDRNSLLSAGVQLMQLGNPDAAADRFKGALALAPNDADALHLLALAHHQAGRLGEALEIIQKAVNLAPSNLGKGNLKLNKSFAQESSRLLESSG